MVLENFPFISQVEFDKIIRQFATQAAAVGDLSKWQSVEVLNSVCYHAKYVSYETDMEHLDRWMLSSSS
jgi:hypothetical protein